MSTDHAYLAFAEHSELRTAAAGFLADGVALGQQVGYFGWGTRDALRGHASELAGLDELLRKGAAQLTSLDHHFRRDLVPDPAALVAFWSGATDAAMNAGFTALRVVTDTTPWAGSRLGRPVFLKGEHLVDRYRLDHPFSQLCAGDASVLDDDALAEVASIHPSSTGVSAPFHLHSTLAADLALRGELDTFAAPLLERVVSALHEERAAGELVIDMGGLAFVDHRALLTLERHAERTKLTRLVVRNPSRVARRLVELLDLSHVRVEPS